MTKLCIYVYLFEKNKYKNNLNQDNNNIMETGVKYCTVYKTGYLK